MKYLLIALLAGAANASELRDVNSNLEQMNTTLGGIATNQEAAADAETSCQTDLRFAQWQVRGLKRLIKNRGWEVTAQEMVQAMADTRE